MKSLLEINATALRSNFAAIRAAAGPAFEPLCVLKANAYGHDAALCGPVLAEAGARWLGVGDLEEGVRLRQAMGRRAGVQSDRHIVVMCGFDPRDATALVEQELTPVVWTASHIEALEAAATRADRRVPVHLEVDSGMARQGAAAGEGLLAVLEVLRRANHVRLEGVFSHLSSSEVAGSAITAGQLERFHRAFAQVLDVAMPEYVHLGNTSAIDEQTTLPWLRSATAQFGVRLLVRPGLALYGYALPLEGRADAKSHLRSALHPVATWKTHILDVREIGAGDTVGYGATFVASGPMRLALLPVGYADGFRREASSGVGDGWVVIGGERTPVVGRVSMNLTIVDISRVFPVPAPGDEVILLGEGVSAEDHARWCGTIPYEILCGMRGHHRLAS